MQTSALKSLDAVLSSSACLFAAVLPKPARPSSPRTLIVRPGGLGDLVCADIALQELSLEARDFTWLIETRSQPWAEFRGLPHICYDVKPSHPFQDVRGRFSRVINTEQFFGLTEAYSLWARAKGGRLLSFDTNRGAGWSDVTVAYDWKDRHETIEFARLFAVAMERPDPRTARLPRTRLFPVTGPPVVVIAGRQTPSRRLDLAAWTALIASWHRNRSFLIAAAPDDDEFAAELAQGFAGLAGIFDGTFSDLCGQIGQSAGVLTMDGGAVHIASFFGVPTRAVFTSGRDRKWHPLGKGSQILRRRDLSCQPCTRFGQVPPCPYGYECLKLDEMKLANAV